MARIITSTRNPEVNYKKYGQTYYDFSTAGGLTLSAGQPTAATGASSTQTDKGMRLQWTRANSGAQAGFRFTPSTAFNFSNVGQWGFEIDFGSDVTGASLAGLRVLMKTSSGGSYANYYNCLAYTGNAKYGRRILWIDKTNFTVGAGTEGTSLFWSSIATVEILWQRSTRNTAVVPADITVCGMYVNYRNQTPTLVFTFDDNDLTQYTEAYLGTTYAGTGMKDYGWKGTLFMNSGSFNVGGSLPTKMTVANAQTMYAAGWDVFNHTDSHLANCWQYTPSIVGTTLTLTNSGGVVHGKSNGDSIKVAKMDPIEMNGTYSTTVDSTTQMHVTIPTPEATTSLTGYNTIDHISSSTLSADIDTCATYLKANGFSKCNDHYAYPFGYHSESNVALLSSKGFKSARIIGAMTGSPASAVNNYMWANAAINPKALDWYRVPCRSLSNTDLASAVLADIDKAIKYGMSMVLCTHNLLSTPAVSRDADLEEWVLLLAGIRLREKQGLLQVRTYSQLYDESTS